MKNENVERTGVQAAAACKLTASALIQNFQLRKIILIQF